MLNTIQTSAISLHREATALDGEAMRLRGAGDRQGAAVANIKARAYRDLAQQVERGELVAVDPARLADAQPFELSHRGQPLIYKRETLRQRLVIAFLFMCTVVALVMWAGANVYPVTGQ